jgi:DNA polymerase III subunit gamma/tau
MDEADCRMSAVLNAPWIARQATDLLAQRGHAWLLQGPSGLGQYELALAMASAWLCEKPTEQGACGDCPSCHAIAVRTHADLTVLMPETVMMELGWPLSEKAQDEIDKKTRKPSKEIRVDAMRDAVEFSQRTDARGRGKAVLVFPAERMNTITANALLKTLEEPPKHAIFILATTEKHKIIPTILSRCQIFDFQRIRVKDIADHLSTIATKEGVSADPEALHQIAMKADGALRDALSIFDQLVTFAGNTLTYKDVLENLHILDYEYYFKVIDAAEKEDISSALLILNDIYEKGFDGHHFVVGLAEHLRNILVCKDPRTASLLETPDTIKQRFVQQATEIEAQRLLRGLQVLSKTDVDYKASKNQRLLIEVALMQLCSLKQEQEKKKG